MPQCTIVIKDYVNVKIEGLDPSTRQKIVNALKFTDPTARHTPRFKLGRWDGKIPFCTAAGSTYFNLLDRAIPILEQNKYEILIDDRRPDIDLEFPVIDNTYFSHKNWPKSHRLEGQPIILNPYQVRAANTFLENTQSIMTLSTGLGKTVLSALLSSVIEKYGRSILIVPSVDLVLQTERDYKNLDLDVGVYYGNRKEWNHKHTIATWQTFNFFRKEHKKYDKDASMDDFKKDVVCVMVDECHTAKGKELNELMTSTFSKVPIRWGFTGSVPLEDYQSISILTSIGPLAGEIKSSELQEKNALPKCEIELIQLNDDHVEFSDYDSEHRFLLTDKERIKHIAGMISDWTKTGNTLVLVDRIPAGEELQKLIPNSVFISGSVKNKKRKEEYDTINIENQKVIIATYGVASTGISIDRLFNIVLFEAGRSFIRATQSIGRGLRFGIDKDFFMIYDICSTLKFSKRHLAKRKIYYNDAKMPVKLKKISYR